MHSLPPSPQSMDKRIEDVQVFSTVHPKEARAQDHNPYEAAADKAPASSPWLTAVTASRGRAASQSRSIAAEYQAREALTEGQPCRPIVAAMLDDMRR